ECGGRPRSIRNAGSAVMTDPLRDVTWDLMPPGACSAHMHMALDEVLLDRVIAGRRPPTMRLWRWTDKALVIGSHQSVANEVDGAAADDLGFVITRRMSGGGTMLCEPDRTITYSLYLPDTLVAGISCGEVAGNLHEYFMRTFDARESAPAKDELEAAHQLVESKYSTQAWINRLP